MAIVRGEIVTLTCAGRDQKKISSAPAGAAGAVQNMQTVAMPMQHLATAVPLAQSLMLQQLAQLSPQQQQQYVNQVSHRL